MDEAQIRMHARIRELEAEQANRSIELIKNIAGSPAYVSDAEKLVCIGCVVALVLDKEFYDTVIAEVQNRVMIVHATGSNKEMAWKP